MPKLPFVMALFVYIIFNHKSIIIGRARIQAIVKRNYIRSSAKDVCINELANWDKDLKKKKKKERKLRNMV